MWTTLNMWTGFYWKPSTILQIRRFLNPSASLYDHYNIMMLKKRLTFRVVEKTARAVSSSTTVLILWQKCICTNSGRQFALTAPVARKNTERVKPWSAHKPAMLALPVERAGIGADGFIGQCGRTISLLVDGALVGFENSVCWWLAETLGRWSREYSSKQFQILFNWFTGWFVGWFFKWFKWFFSWFVGDADIHTLSGGRRLDSGLESGSEFGIWDFSNRKWIEGQTTGGNTGLRLANSVNWSTQIRFQWTALQVNPFAWSLIEWRTTNWWTRRSWMKLINSNRFEPALTDAGEDHGSN